YIPKKDLGVDIENNLALTYVVIEGKEKIVKELKKAAKKADTIYLAPDPDREGEAIAWHIAEELGGNADNIFRVEFNEITERAVKEAIENPRKINKNLVDAQQARRVLDRLVGYKLSPVLWKKVRRGLSAGRVQSVALRIVVDREREIDAFTAVEYWSVTANLEGNEPPPFDSKLFFINGEKAEIGNEAQTNAILSDLENEKFIIKKIDKKKRKRMPSPPFITSTLQQEASSKLRFTAKKTMVVAQQLYEGLELGAEGSVGLITYMRTDSVRVAAEAQQEAQAVIKSEFGPDYLPATPPVYKTKKSAQDAHEAIRPASALKTPDSLKGYLNRDQRNLYKLIWNRFVASQMNPAQLEQTSVDIAAAKYIFRTTGSVVKFPGFMKVYTESSDNELEEGILPAMNEGDELKVNAITPKQHFTQPPPRFSEATLVKELEAKGIGRPSTYASILSTIIDRKYTEKNEGRFKPTDLGMVVSDFLTTWFANLMDYQFTERMEGDLDMIEDGGFKWVDKVMEFYGPLSKEIEKTLEEAERVKPSEKPTDEICENCGKPMVIKWGRHGNFIACTGWPECKTTKPLETDEGQAEVVISDEKCEKCGSEMVLKAGKFGRFLACSKYPECKTTKAISIGIKCPDDGGDLLERRTRKGKVFYSCGNYPKCKFATWYKPVKQACPDCKAEFLVEKKNKKEEVLLCLNKDCGYKDEIQSEAETEEELEA
ncbi:type I DNA topoisomerase, partial [bacterium]|nr:type I DNA topoisomerase [bacterium]